MKRLTLYVHTLQRLKGRQIAHLLLYRFPGWYLLSRFRAIRNTYGQFVWAAFDCTCLKREMVFEAPDRFTAFQRSIRFGEKWNWGTLANGALWNYQLQYMDFLLDDAHSKEIRYRLLQSISDAILRRRLKLEPYPVSLRLVHCYAFLGNSGIEMDLSVQRALGVQVRFLEDNLEFHLDANHLLENYIALCFSFLFLGRDSKSAASLSMLIKELEKQVMKDGGHYERSLSYHCGILSRLLCLISVMKVKSVHPVEREKLCGIAAGMLVWIREMTQGLRYFPLFNDCISWEKEDLEKLFASAKAVDIDTRSSEQTLVSFYLMKRLEGVLWVNSQGPGPSYQPGHAHADLMSFVLGSGGRMIIVDPGISDYEDRAIRLRERSTAYHNTVFLPGCNQSEIWASFRLGRRAEITEVQRTADLFEAEVSWYQGHVHVRRFAWDEKALIISDSFNTPKEASAYAVAAFHLDFRIERPVIRGLNVSIPGTALNIQFHNAERIELDTYLQAFRFNEVHEAHRLLVYFYNRLETHIQFNF